MEDRIKAGCRCKTGSYIIAHLFSWWDLHPWALQPVSHKLAPAHLKILDNLLSLSIKLDISIIGDVKHKTALPGRCQHFHNPSTDRNLPPNRQSELSGA